MLNDSFLQILYIPLPQLCLTASKAVLSSVNLTLLAMWAGRWLCPEVDRQGLITGQSCEWMPSAVNGPYTYKFTLVYSRIECYLHTESDGFEYGISPILPWTLNECYTLILQIWKRIIFLFYPFIVSAFKWIKIRNGWLWIETLQGLTFIA